VELIIKSIIGSIMGVYIVLETALGIALEMIFRVRISAIGMVIGIIF
jgi:hypothetical protein